MGVLSIILLVIVASSVVDAVPSHCSKIKDALQNADSENTYKRVAGECTGAGNECDQTLCVYKKLKLVDSNNNVTPDTYVEFMLPKGDFEDLKNSYKAKFPACKNAELPKTHEHAKDCPALQKIEGTLTCTTNAIMKECGLTELPA